MPEPTSDNSKKTGPVKSVKDGKSPRSGKVHKIEKQNTTTEMNEAPAELVRKPAVDLASVLERRKARGPRVSAARRAAPVIPDTLDAYIEYVNEHESGWPRTYSIRDSATGNIIGGFVTREKARPARDRLNKLAYNRQPAAEGETVEIKPRFFLTKGEDHLHNVPPEMWP